MIALWGPSSSGKTALLSYLYLRATATNAGWHVFPTRESLPEVIKQSNQILRGNQFPLGTRVTDEHQISYDFKDLETDEVFRLETKDRAGIRSERMDESGDAEFLESLAASDGIVLILDYGRGHREAEVIDTLAQVYVRRQSAAGEKDPRPLAVCISKVDQLILRPEDLRRLQDNGEKFVQDHLSPELLGRINQFHSTVKYFPMSAVGLRVCYGSVQKSVFYDERLVLRATTRGTPMNIIEPFVWIFKEVRKRA
jgi:hypothetical protein